MAYEMTYDIWHMTWHYKFQDMTNDITWHDMSWHKMTHLLSIYMHSVFQYYTVVNAFDHILVAQRGCYKFSMWSTTQKSKYDK